ncbi:hypothetical protein F383_10838 [Gossypium arboreum]|uniref:Uncharacterized protein n=1 Tax=Gossypium arboreum TaxID=29729 RepID=A0A0B0N591_GOSAR|nr:hypothetical protein F383_10838 [Gossypium arboreum]
MCKTMSGTLASLIDFV